MGSPQAVAAKARMSASALGTADGVPFTLDSSTTGVDSRGAASRFIVADDWRPPCVTSATGHPATPAQLPMNVLVLNAGSSTLKFQLIRTDQERLAANTDEKL